jgi:hypothetical protein
MSTSPSACARARCVLVPGARARLASGPKPSTAARAASSTLCRWIAGLPTTVAGFSVIRNHVDLLLGKKYDVPTVARARRRRRRATATAVTEATAAEEAAILWLLSDVLVVVYDSESMSR